MINNFFLNDWGFGNSLIKSLDFELLIIFLKKNEFKYNTFNVKDKITYKKTY